MPIYEFVCSDCSSSFEKMVFSSENAEIVCPSCNSPKVEKQFSTFAALIGQSSPKNFGPPPGGCGGPGGCPGGGCGFSG